MITIVNYGLGNIQAFVQAYKLLGVQTTVATTAGDLDNAERIILPGVGSFDWAMERLQASGMRERLDDLVLREKRPILGVCVGMQMLAKRSAEGTLPGLGWIDATVERLVPEGDQRVDLPHMGWNDVSPRRGDCLFREMERDASFYFLHSYYVAPQEGDVLADASYGRRFACAVRHGNIWGVQFHPEKSHRWGTKLLQNFAEAV